MITPYEYALMSHDCYDRRYDHANEASIPADSHRSEDLIQRGWRAVVPINADNGYHAVIYLNDRKQQVVIAHRGSQNLDSWITDLETVVGLKPGSFILSTIAQALNHPLIKERIEAGYTLSTTGHSLGGFLAQVCVYWAQRRDQAQSYYPDISAVVFDSPGVLDFLAALQSNLGTHQFELSTLNIHNFCPRPTIVNTYGRHVGTFWQLGVGHQLTVPFLSAHELTCIFEGLDPETGYPRRFQQMGDWPHADYSHYASVSHLSETLITEVVKLPLRFLNGLYKGLKQLAGYRGGETTYERLTAGKGQVSHVLKALKNETAQSQFEQIETAIKGHYAPLSGDHSQYQLPLYHFSVQQRKILQDLSDAKRLLRENACGWEDQCRQTFGEESVRLIQAFTIVSPERGRLRRLLQLNEDYFGVMGNVFVFQAQFTRVFTVAIYDERGFAGYLLDCFAKAKEQLKGHTEQLAELRLAMERLSPSNVEFTVTQDFSPLHAGLVAIDATGGDSVITKAQRQARQQEAKAAMADAIENGAHHVVITHDKTSAEKLAVRVPSSQAANTFALARETLGLPSELAQPDSPPRSPVSPPASPSTLLFAKTQGLQPISTQSDTAAVKKKFTQL